MFSKHNVHAEVDLHGASLEEAERLVKHWLAQSSSKGIVKIRFVTGRGNHINAKGESGVLYKNFPNWIADSSHKDRVVRCEPYDGYYEVYLQPTHAQKPSTKQLEEIANLYLANNLAAIKQQADKGEAYFQVLYGKYLETIIPVKHKKVFKYFNLAAAQNFSAGMYELARCFFHGIGIRQSDTAAFQWLEKARNLGHIPATVALGDSYWLGDGIPEDAYKATALYAIAAANNHPVALRKLAFAYGSGIGALQDRQKSFELYKKSADLDEPTSQYNVGVRYLNGDGIPPDEKLAYQYFLLSAQNGDPDAQFKVGEILLVRHKDSAEKQLAMDWLKKAAKNGSSQANTLLTMIGDTKEIPTYLKKAAESGNVMAKLRLQFEDQSSAEVNKEEFSKKFTQAIKESYKLDTNEILFLDHTSKFLLLDSMLLEKKKAYREKALHILNSLIDNGCIFALRRLAFFNFRGFSDLQIKLNYPKAVFYLKKGVFLQDSSAMVTLGYCYEQGLGVEKSPEQGLALYQQAAKYNNPTANFNLALCEFKRKPTPDLLLINEYLTLAIKYENDKKIMANLTSGLLDRQEPIAARAEKLLADLQRFLPLYNDLISPKIVDAFSQTDLGKIEQSLFETQGMLQELDLKKPIYQLSSSPQDSSVNTAAMLDRLLKNDSAVATQRLESPNNSDAKTISSKKAVVVDQSDTLSEDDYNQYGNPICTLV